jgi:hypothetical protein
MCSISVIVVEEPGEEPKLYRQDTGELVTNASFIDPLLNGENNEYPEELPKEKEKAKYPSNNKSKLYKDIDELLENLKKEDANLKNTNINNSGNNKNTNNKQFNLRRNSIHLSSASRKEKLDKKEKRYSYNPRDEYHLTDSSKIYDTSSFQKTGDQQQQKKMTKSALFAAENRKSKVISEKELKSSHNLPTSLANESLKKEDTISSNLSSSSKYHQHEKSEKQPSKHKNIIESSSSKSKLHSNKSILIKNKENTGNSSSIISNNGSNKKSEIINEILNFATSSQSKANMKKSDHSNSEYRPRSCSTKSSNRKLRHHRVNFDLIIKFLLEKSYLYLLELQIIKLKCDIKN